MIAGQTAASAASQPASDPALQRLEREIARLSTVAGGVVGVTAIHLETGRRISMNGTERFPMASTFKLPMISDNSATDVMLRTAGGTEAVTSRMRALGIEGVSVNRSTAQLIADWAGVTNLPPEDRWNPVIFFVAFNTVKPEAKRPQRRNSTPILATRRHPTGWPLCSSASIARTC